MQKIAFTKSLWRSMPPDLFPNVFYLPCEHHFIFFRAFSDDTIGIIGIFHGKQDIPNRLLDK